jgi:hypothetical protein
MTNSANVYVHRKLLRPAATEHLQQRERVAQGRIAERVRILVQFECHSLALTPTQLPLASLRQQFVLHKPCEYASYSHANLLALSFATLTLDLL